MHGSYLHECTNDNEWMLHRTLVCWIKFDKTRIIQDKMHKTCLKSFLSYVLHITQFRESIHDLARDEYSFTLGKSHWLVGKYHIVHRHCLSGYGTLIIWYPWVYFHWFWQNLCIVPEAAKWFFTRKNIIKWQLALNRYSINYAL